MDIKNIARKGVLWVVGVAGVGAGAVYIPTSIYNGCVGGWKATTTSFSNAPDANKKHLDAVRQEHRGEIEAAGGVSSALIGTVALVAAWPQAKRREDYYSM